VRKAARCNRELWVGLWARQTLRKKGFRNKALACSWFSDEHLPACLNMLEGVGHHSKQGVNASAHGRMPCQPFGNAPWQIRLGMHARYVSCRGPHHHRPPAPSPLS
jgi:hypothetical protein